MKVPLQCYSYCPVLILCCLTGHKSQHISGHNYTEAHNEVSDYFLSSNLQSQAPSPAFETTHSFIATQSLVTVCIHFKPSFAKAMLTHMLVTGPKLRQED
jgi:hypothetical protein